MAEEITWVAKELTPAREATQSWSAMIDGFRVNVSEWSWSFQCILDDVRLSVMPKKVGKLITLSDHLKAREEVEQVVYKMIALGAEPNNY